MNEIGWLMKDKIIEHRNFTQWKKKRIKKKRTEKNIKNMKVGPQLLLAPKGHDFQIQEAKKHRKFIG